MNSRTGKPIPRGDIIGLIPAAMGTGRHHQQVDFYNQ